MKLKTDIMEIISSEKEYHLRCQAFKKCSYGDNNSKKKFRVLSNKSKWAHKQGLLSTVFIILPNVIEARKHGYIPVIDLKRNDKVQCLLQEPRLSRTENAWEYYFTQPDKGISLEEVRQSKYVEEQVKDCLAKEYFFADGCPVGDAKMDCLSKAIRQNIHLQPELKKRVSHEKRTLLSQSNKILGVGIRAGYRSGIMNNISTFNGHPVVGSCVEYIRDIEQRLKEWNYDSFFLAIDDRQYLEEIKKYFGKSCIHLERPRIHYFQDALNDIPQAFDERALIEFEGLSARNRNEDYLTELYLLAQCDSLFASRGTGYTFSYLLNNGRYTYAKFLDLGEFQYQGQP